MALAKPIHTPREAPEPKKVSEARHGNLSRLRPLMLGLLAILGVWAILGLFLGSGNVPLLPAPWTVAQSGWSVRTQLSADVAASAKEALGGWVIGSGIAILVAIAAGQLRLIRDLVTPVIEILRPISPIAWAPLGIIWFGANYSGKVFLVGLVSFFLVIIHALEGTTRHDPYLRRAKVMLGMSPIRNLLWLDLPEAVPQIIIGLRLAIAGAWGGVVIAEIVGGQGSAGLGSLELFAEQAINIPQVLVGVVIVAILGYVASAIFDKLSHVAFPWLPEANQEVLQ